MLFQSDSLVERSMGKSHSIRQYFPTEESMIQGVNENMNGPMIKEVSEEA